MAYGERTYRQREFERQKQQLTDQGVSEAEATVITRTNILQGYFDFMGYKVNFKDLAWFLLLLKFAKTPDGQQRLLKMLETFRDMMKAIAMTAHPENRTTSYGSLFLQALVLRRFGLITDSDFNGFIVGLTLTNAAEVGEEILSALPIDFKFKLGLTI